MAVKGVFTSDASISGDREGDFAAAILYTEPGGNAPLFALTSGMESADAQDTIISWFEEQKASGRTAVTNAAGTGTTFTVQDASTFTAGAVFIVESTGEHVYVQAIAGNSLTVERGFAGTTNTTLDGSVTPKYISQIGTAFQEASARPQGIVNLGTARFNFTQIFRNSWDISGTATAVKYVTGNKKAKAKRDCASYHAEQIEKALWFGRRTVGVKDSKPFRTMDGILTQITTNVETGSGPISWDDLDAFIMAVQSRNIQGKPNERLVFCGNGALATLNKIARNYGHINIEPGETEFGMAVSTWISPWGRWKLITHPLFNESPFWQNDIYVIHPGAIRIRYLRRTIDEEYVQNNGDDAEFGVMTTELSVEYKAEITGGKFYNFAEADSPVVLTQTVE